MIKFIMGFVTGAAIGAGTTYILVKKKFEDQAQEDIDQMKQEYKERTDILYKSQTDKPSMDDVIKKTSDTSMKETSSQKPEKPAPINYTAFSKEGQKNMVEQDIPEEEIVEESPKEGPNEIPYSISADDFALSNTYYNKVTLNYYEEDDTLADEDETIIPNPASYLGEFFRNWFGEYETDVAYVRNEAMGTDFEVILHHCEFAR